MKGKNYKIIVFTLFLFITGAGCNKDDTSEEKSIIGKWQWLYSTGGLVISYPHEGQIITLEFTKNYSLIERKNDSLIFETKFSINGDTLNYSRGSDMSYQIKINKDTLNLIFKDAGFNDYYKRLR